MKKIIQWTTLFILSIILAGCVGPGSSKSALRVDSSPKATIFLDGKHIGQTPFYDEKIQSGEYTLKIVPETSTGISLVSWEVKIKLSPDVLTFVNRDLKETDDLSSGEILNLETISTKDSGEIMIVGDPDGASVKLDGQEKGITPLLLKDIPAGDHEVVLGAVGHADRIIRAQVTNGYKVVVNAQLAAVSRGADEIPITTPTSTQSAKPITGSPTPKKTIPSGKASVRILETPTGWLRVRMGPNLSATEEAKVNTGDILLYLGEEGEWFKVEYQEGKEGWISSQYAQKITPTP
jgi:hypothetical protein